MDKKLEEIVSAIQTLQKQIDSYHGEYDAEFLRLFIKTKPESVLKTLKGRLQEAEGQLSDLGLQDEYLALQQEKARMTSASVRLALLMQSMKAKGADALAAKLQADGAKDYAQRVQRLSEKAMDKEAVREKFAVQKKGSALEIGNVKVGSIIRFGHYPQTASGNDNTPIEWQVLETDGKTALCIAKYGLDCKQFHHEWRDITWEKCDLRKWLNGEFLQKAFTTVEQGKIVQTTVKADKNPQYRSAQGNDTKDKVFLLSILEAQKYFGNDTARRASPTAYAVKQGAYKDSDNGNCWWWLRSSGDYSSGAADVNYGGSIGTNGGCVRIDSYTVRLSVLLRLL